MNALSRFPDAPSRIQALPVDHRGFPVPWFVAYIDGIPDFRVVGPGKIAEAHNRNLCWVCGQPRGVFGAFVVGPMCAVNRTSSEPPSHLECARFSARACPFLTQPRMRRNEKDMPAEASAPAGEMITRNPGVALIWVTKSYRPFRAQGGHLFRMGDPTSVEWLAQGRSATREEVLASIDSGLPQLAVLAAQDGPRALDELQRRVDAVAPLVPAERAA